jgi:hypothetical protein
VREAYPRRINKLDSLALVPLAWEFLSLPDEGTNRNHEGDKENRLGIHDIPVATAFATQPGGTGWDRMAPSPSGSCQSANKISRLGTGWHKTA